MQPPALTLPRSDPRSPVVLPRGCEALVRIRASDWPVALVIPADSGLLDSSCGYWHGLAAANCGSQSGQDGA